MGLSKLVKWLLIAIILFLVSVFVFMRLKYGGGSEAWAHFFSFLYDITHLG